MANAAAALEVTPRQALDALHRVLGLSDEDLSGALGASPRTLQRWRANTAYPQQAARRRLAWLLRLQERVQATFKGANAARRWSSSQSRYLRGITPAEAIRAGRIDRAEQPWTLSTLAYSSSQLTGDRIFNLGRPFSCLGPRSARLERPRMAIPPTRL
jgi:uncharacterized protein (DUF2384 family)